MEQSEAIRIRASAVIVRGDEMLVVTTRGDKGEYSSLPGGGVKPGEPVYQALRREVREETEAEIEVGRLLLVSEYVPSRDGAWMGPHPEIDLVFACELRQGSEPRLPADPDPGQRAVRWVPVKDLNPGIDPPLRPQIGEKLLACLRDAQTGVDPFGTSV